MISSQLRAACLKFSAREGSRVRRWTAALGMVVIAAATQACTGGEVTDSNGNGITNGVGRYEVTFTNVASGKSYYTGIDSKGTFGFDPYASASGSNNAVFLPEGNYSVSVGQAGNAYTTPYTVDHSYSSNSSCPDYYDNYSTNEQCALYQLMLLDHTGTPPAPYPTTFLGLNVTVIPLAPEIYPNISVTSQGENFTITGTGFVPNSFAFYKVTGNPGGDLFHDETVTASSTGTMTSTWVMCLNGNDTSVTIVGYDETTENYSNSITLTPPKC